MDPNMRSDALTSLQQALLRKNDLESAMLAAPDDAAPRRAYFDYLIRFSAGRTGLLHAVLPELGHPVMFRTGTHDVVALARVFRDDAYALPMRAAPRRILELGAHAGFASIWLARRFPDADILAVEPAANNFRLVSMNTAPYVRIRAMPAAAWSARLALTLHTRGAGDWGIEAAAVETANAGHVQGLTIADILQAVGWDHVDLVVADFPGAARAVFADPAARWLHRLDAAIVRAGEPAVAGFPSARFAHHAHGPFDLYARHEPFRAALRPTPRAMKLISDAPGLFPLALHDVEPSEWGFFIFDGHSCQLHPNAPGAPPARASFPRTLDGQTTFSAGLLHAGSPSAPITFTLRIEDETNTPVLRATHTLTSGQTHTLSANFPTPLTGRHRIILQTEMAPGAPSHANAWARWLGPGVA